MSTSVLRTQKRTATRPRASLVTWDKDAGPFTRIALSLARGFEELGEPFDVVRLGGPQRILQGNVTREIYLGDLRARQAVRPLAHYLRSARPEVAVVAPAHLSPFAVIAGRLARVPVLPWEPAFVLRETATACGVARLLPMLQRVTYATVPLVAAVSSDVAAVAPGRRSFVLPNPVDGEELRSRARRSNAARPFRLCTVGNLVPSKGIDVLFEALDRVGDRLGDWELIVIGDGPERKRLEEAAGPRVQFVGHVDDPYSLIANADLMVHPARWEGFGVAIVEALALGTPVVATSCLGGPREILADGAGVLVPPEDPDALGDAIRQLVVEPRLREELVKRGRRRADDFAPTAIATRLLELVDEVGVR